MILAVDSGNSSSKAGLFRDEKLINVFEFNDYHALIDEIHSLNPRKILISSVNFSSEQFKKDLPDMDLFILDQHTPLPFEMLYKSVETLGVDRIAATAGAWEKFPDHDLLVIDAGTCITYDLIISSGRYLGGSISPGIRMRFRSLNDYTARLPLVEFESDANLIGDTTVKAMLSGVVHGTMAEVSGMITQYKTEYPDLKVVFTGGHVKFFESKLKEPIFAIPNLVMRGLFAIYKFNERY